MRNGAAYMGHHNPFHIDRDLYKMKELQIADVLPTAQENDFIYVARIAGFPDKHSYIFPFPEELSGNG